jgi:tetratricopeptide (TPR) repeat protein
MPTLSDHFKVETYEAQTFSHYYKGDIAAAVTAGLGWYRQEPFSGKAASFTATLSSVGLEDHRTAHQILKQTLKRNTADEAVRLNLAYCLASDNQLDDAEAELSKVSTRTLSDVQKVQLIANEGLVAFRRGRHSDGEVMYQSAIEKANSLAASQSKATAAVAWLFYAREAFRAELPHRHEVLREVQKRKAILTSAEYSMLFERLAHTQ